MREHRLFSLMFVLACLQTLLGMSDARAAEVQAGPIFNNMDAQGKCPRVCQQNGNSRWNGQWHTIPGTATSVCDCEGGASPIDPKRGSQWADAGPLFNNMDAQNKCPEVCQRTGGNWDGNWKTTQPGRMSVCSCGGQRAASAFGAGASCSAQSRGACSGCSVQCPPGQRASCQEGSTWNDKVGNGDRGCVTNAQCRCG
jgi:hypothetical protein